MTVDNDNFDNPYRAPREASWPPAVPGALQASLVERAWLWRRFWVETDSRVYDVIYNGRGLFYEEVLVDGHVMLRRLSWLWFVPHFEFQLDRHQVAIDVRVWPWLKIRRFRLAIDRMAVYEEGLLTDFPD
jgi:hypothetical protein